VKRLIIVGETLQVRAKKQQLEKQGLFQAQSPLCLCVRRSLWIVPPDQHHCGVGSLLSTTLLPFASLSSTTLLPFTSFEYIQSVICSNPVSVPHDCSGLVHWRDCVCTRQCKQQQERAHTFQVTALEFSSQRKRQQERAYHPNNHTRVQTQGLSQSSSAQLPRLACVLNQTNRLSLIKNIQLFGFPTGGIFLLGSSNFGAKTHFFLKKRPYVSLVAWDYGLLVSMYICHGKKIS